MPRTTASVLRGSGGGDFFGISPDLTGTFGIDVHDVRSSAVNTLFVAGDEYERRTFGYLHAFAESGGVYVSNSRVYFTNTYSDSSHNHAVTTSSLISFDGGITQLKVLAAPDISNNISVGPRTMRPRRSPPEPRATTLMSRRSSATSL